MSWDIKKLNESCISIADGDHLPPPKSEAGIPFVTIANVDSYNHFDFTDTMFVPQNYYDKLDNKRKAQKGDILLTVVGSFGIPILITDDTPFVFQRHIAILRPDPKVIDSRFLYYTMLSKSFYAQADAYAIGAAQRTISLTSLRQMKVAVPDLDTQEKIADALSLFDNLIDNNNKQIKSLEQMAENLYKEWFVRFRFPGYENAKFENGLPKGWEIQQAQNIFDITIGRTPDRKQFDYFTNNENDALWLSISDMKDNMFITKSSEYLTAAAINKVNMPMVATDTVLLSFKLSVGRVAITTKLSCTNEAIAHFKTKDKDLLEYTYLYLKLFNYQKLGNTSAIGNAVNSTIIKMIKFVLPDRSLLEMFHNSAKDIFSEIKNLKYSNENLIKQRDLLLPRLMSGKLEV